MFVVIKLVQYEQEYVTQSEKKALQVHNSLIEQYLTCLMQLIAS